MRGRVEEPSYEDVCSRRTGHVEVVQVTYNAQEVRFFGGGGQTGHLGGGVGCG
jgi:hypothetical protein